MQVRKAVAGAVLGVGASALALTGSGVASADYGHYTPPKPPKVTIQAQKTVVKNNGQVGNGNVQQTASGNAGQINNPQVGFGTNVGLQVPLSVNLNGFNSKGSDTTQGQTATQKQRATGNESYNSTQVNNANGNGNHSETNIGTQDAD
jgi:hypothetical protein